jgi:hypothetical protein
MRKKYYASASLGRLRQLLCASSTAVGQNTVLASIGNAVQSEEATTKFKSVAEVNALGQPQSRHRLAGSLRSIVLDCSISLRREGHGLSRTYHQILRCERMILMP